MGCALFCRCAVILAREVAPPPFVAPPSGLCFVASSVASFSPSPSRSPSPFSSPFFPPARVPPAPPVGSAVNKEYSVCEGVGAKGGFNCRLGVPSSRLPPRSGLPALCPRSAFCVRFPPPACALFAVEKVSLLLSNISKRKTRAFFRPERLPLCSPKKIFGSHVHHLLPAGVNLFFKQCASGRALSALALFFLLAFPPRPRWLACYRLARLPPPSLA